MRCFLPPSLFLLTPRLYSRSAVLWITAPGVELLAQNQRIRTKLLHDYRRQTVRLVQSLAQLKAGVFDVALTRISHFFIHLEISAPIQRH